MAKYQFFCKPNTNRKEFTFLNPTSDTFPREKEQLLAQGFEVEDDYIYADSEPEAIEKFKSNFIYATEEYAASNPESAFIIFLKESLHSIIKAFKKK